MTRTRVHNLNISLDGYAAGDHVTFDAPIGGAERLFAWFDGRAIHGVDTVDAPVTLDRALTSLWGQGIGAEIMGRRKFGPQVGPWPDDGWRGWWGDEPPFHTPVFVLSHHPIQRLTSPTVRASGSWTVRRTRCSAWPERRRTAATSASAAALRRCVSSYRPT